MIDVLIPVGPRDKDIAKICAKSIRKFVSDVRTIWIVSNEDPNIEGTTFVDEKLLPFSMQQVADRLGNANRAGWYFQQLLKLYAPTLIPDILEHYLVVDADTFFLQECKFVDDGRPIFNLGTEYHLPYFEHMYRLHPGLVKTIQYSGITHTLLYTRTWLKELISLIEDQHPGKLFWEIYLDEIDPAHKDASGAAENELYFTYCMHMHIQEVVIKAFPWENISCAEEVNRNCVYNSLHWYLRGGEVDFEAIEKQIFSSE